MKEYCTYFDSNYLAIGLSLYQSLCEHEAEFQLWVLCLDDSCYQTLTEKNLPYIKLVSVEQLELYEPSLNEAKANRSIVEYYFTCTASFMAYLFASQSSISFLTYLDSDLFFFDSADTIYQCIGDASIAIVAHRYSNHLKAMRQYGVFNVGWVSFRRDQQGMQCLSEWKVQCLEWCYDKLEERRFADQKYLDAWPEKFSQLVVIEHKGANVAPWNLANYPLRLALGKLMVDDQALVFFHFHGLKKVRGRIYNAGLGLLRVRLGALAKNHIYRPYLRILNSNQLDLESHSIALGSNKERPIEKAHRSLNIKTVFKTARLILYSLFISRCYLLSDK